MTLTRFYFTDRARPKLEIGLGSTVMAEGAGLWDVSLWDAPDSLWNGDEPLWRDFSCDVIDAHIEIGRGRVSDSFPVGTADVVVDNTSGWADPSLEFEVDSEPGYITFDGSLAELSVPDSAAISFAGDFTMILRLYVTTAPSSGAAFFMTKGVAPDLAYRLSIFPNTDLSVEISPNGTTGSASFFLTAAQPRVVGSWRWLAFAFDANDGSAQHRGTWWYGGSDEDPQAWQVIETAIWPGVMTIHNSAAALKIGTDLACRIGHFELRSGHGGLSGGAVTVGGTAVFTLDGWQLGAHDVGATTITAATGQTITVVPDGSSSPVVTPAVNPAGSPLLKLRPGRPIRIGVAHTTFGNRWRFNGFIDEILPTDSPDDWSTVTLKCIDALGEAGRAKLTSDVEVGAGETARTRFIRILNAITWPSTKRAISSSAIRTLYAAEMDGQVVDLLRQTAESEGGWAFGDNQGRVVLQHRDWLYHEIGEEVDGIIGNFGDTGTELLLESGEDLLLEQGDELLLEEPGDEVCPSRWERAFARADISTRVILDRDFPSTVEEQPDPAQADDLPAQVLYGIEPYERNDLWTLDDGELQLNAGRILATRTAELSMPRIRGVEINAERSDPDSTDDAVDLLSTLSIYTPSRYRCRLRTERGDVFDANFFAVGITEDISAEAWTANISLDRTRPYEILDPVDYVWDTARWDRSLWN